MGKINWRDILWIGKGERKGILAVLLLAITALCLIRFYPNRQTNKFETNTEEEKTALLEFLSTIKHTDSIRFARFKSKQPATVVLSAFDPNLADSITFIRLGLPPWVARNILRYRNKGGIFRKPADFAKIYGISQEKFEQLQPYITLAEQSEALSKDTAIKTKPITDIPPHIAKYSKGKVVDLNRADTNELKRIPGIGSRLAWLIINYRKQLGGYYQVEQLREIKQMADSVLPWFKVDSMSIHKLNINRISIERLKAHPYFNFYQAKVIVEHRRRLGPLRSFKDIELYEEFTEADFARMRPYVCFE